MGGGMEDGGLELEVELELELELESDEFGHNWNFRSDIMFHCATKAW